jgi:starch phosphorylase
VVIDKKNLPCDIGVEVVVIDHDNLHKGPRFIEAFEFNLVKTEGSRLYFETAQSLNDPGTRQYGLRVFPKHPGLPHRHDFAYMKWI